MNTNRGRVPAPAPRVLPSHGEISHCAKTLWSLMGQPAGRDDLIWLEAERRLNRRRPGALDWRASPSRWVGAMRERLRKRFPGPPPERSETSL